MRISFAFLLLTCAFLAAQDPTGAIEGTAKDAKTGAPIAGISVRLNGPLHMAPVTTDAKGHFAFAGLTPGSYQIFTAPGNGYSHTSKRARVQAGQTLSGFDLDVPPQSVIAGRILDRDGKPMPEVTIGVRAPAFRQGRPALESFHWGNTDDLGEFRIDKLEPGQYYLEALPKALRFHKTPERKPDDPGKPPVYANIITYYPGTPSQTGAQLITLGVGEHREGLDLRLLREKTFCVSFIVTAPQGLKFWTQLMEDTSMSQSRVAGGGNMDGDLEVCGVPSGSYRLMALGNDDQQNLFYAAEAFAVSNSAVRLQPVKLAQAGPLKGKLTIAGAKPEDKTPSGIALYLEPYHHLGSMGETTSADVEPSGEFVFKSVSQDEWWLNILHLPSGYYVKDARAGSREAYAVPFRPGDGDLSIILSPGGATVTGTVADGDNNPINGASITLSLATLNADVAPNQLFTTTSDDKGQFSFTGVPPGKYRLLAFEHLTLIQRGNPDFIRAAQPRSGGGGRGTGFEIGDDRSDFAPVTESCPVREGRGQRIAPGQGTLFARRPSIYSYR